MEKKERLTELSYQVANVFAGKEFALAYLEKSGFANPRLHLGKLYYLLHTLRVKPHLERSDASKHDWVSLHTSVLRDVFGNLKYFYKLVKQLEKDGYITRLLKEDGKPSYQTGKQSIQYRLEPCIQNQEWKIITRSAEDCVTTKKLIHFTTKDWLPVDWKLFEMLGKFKIHPIRFFEKTNTENFMDSNFKKMVRLIRGKAISNLKEKSKNELTENVITARMKLIYNAYSDSYFGIRHGVKRLDVGKHGRRCTHITNMPKYLRKFLYVEQGSKKCRLEEVDVKNSQVLLSLTIMPDSLKNTMEYLRFKNLVEGGTFYEFFAKEQGIELTEENRKTIKQMYFLCIYGEPNKFYVFINKGYKVLRRCFPNIINWLYQYKKQNGYKKPSHLMHRVESDITIHHVSNKAFEMGLLFTQIYDSFLCLKEDVETFNNLIKEGYKQHGVIAKTNIDFKSC